MRTYIILALATVTLLATCNGNNVKQSSDKIDDVIDSIVTQVIDISPDSSAHLGTYYGTIPANNNQGIEITLRLNLDNSFNQKNHTNQNTISYTGNYTINDKIITTISDNNDTTFYKLGQNKITMLDHNKKTIKGELANLYILTKK